VSNWVTRTEPGLSPWWRYIGFKSIEERFRIPEINPMNRGFDDFRNWDWKKREADWRAEKLGFQIRSDTISEMKMREKETSGNL
jgi:hypothetical protein